MKKFVAGLIVGAVLFIPVGALAYTAQNLPASPNIIYEIGGEHILISVFDDQNNKCYVAYEDRSIDSMPSISCVKNGGLEKE